MNEEHKSIAATIRDILKPGRVMSIAEISAASDGLTAKQVRAACFEMAKREAVVKCGTGARQLFKLGSVAPKRRFNTTIAPAQSAPVVRVTHSVETVEEWMRRTGRTVQRLPVGATAFPLRRIAA